MAKVISPSKQKPWEPIPDGIVTNVRIAQNVVAAYNTGHPEFCEYGEPREEVVSICGSGPSLADTYKSLRGDIWACNDAHNFLLDHGVVPKYAMVWDPQGPEVPGCPAYCFRETHPDVTYLIASMCDPAVFEKVKNNKVLIWHPDLGETVPILDWLKGCGSKARVAVGGMTSGAVGRSMQFAYEMGYRKMEVHGTDGSTRNGYIHFDELECDRNQEIIDAKCFGRQFFTTPQMYRQAQEFPPLMEGLVNVNKADVRIHGDGLIPWVAAVFGWHVNSPRAA